MISQTRALELIQDSLTSLRQVGLVEQDVVVNDDIVLLGSGSPLDSIAFVTFITDLEDRLSRETGQELYLVLKDIHNFNIGNTHLSAGTLAQYVAELAAKAKS